MEVAVAGVEHVDCLQALLGAELVNAAQNIGELFAWNRAIHAVVVGRDPSHGGEGGLAASPEARLGFIILSNLNARSAMFA